MSFMKLDATFYLRLKLTTEYDSNIFTLSQNDLDRFQNHQSFEYIKTTDDLKEKIDFRVSKKFVYHAHNITPFVQPTIILLMKNQDKQTHHFLSGFLYSYKGFSINSSYGYYPQNYLRNFLDQDGTQQNEKFIYDKMMWRFSSSYKISNYIQPQLYYKHDFDHYNQYWTEYDGITQTYGVGWRLTTNLLSSNFFYYYKIFNPRHNSQETQEIYQNIKDSSYEADLLEAKISTKRQYHLLSDYRLFCGYKREIRYFQSSIPIAIDSYHTTRKDTINSINAGLDLWFMKNLTFTLDFLYRFRNVQSDNYRVIKAKEFDKYMIRAIFTWNTRL